MSNTREPTFSNCGTKNRLMTIRLVGSFSFYMPSLSHGKRVVYYTFSTIWDVAIKMNVSYVFCWDSEGGEAFRGQDCFPFHEFTNGWNRDECVWEWYVFPH